MLLLCIVKIIWCRPNCTCSHCRGGGLNFWTAHISGFKSRRNTNVTSPGSLESYLQAQSRHEQGSFYYAFPAFSRSKVEKLRYFYGQRCVTLRIFILGQCVSLRIKNWHELKETLSETVTVSDNWFVFNVEIGTEVGHVTRDSDTTFKVKRSSCKGRGISK